MAAAVAQIGLIIGVTPGGLGLVEAGWAGALHKFGVSSMDAAKFLLAQRILIFVSVLLIALLSVMEGYLTKRRNI